LKHARCGNIGFDEWFLPTGAEDFDFRWNWRRDTLIGGLKTGLIHAQSRLIASLCMFAYLEQ
jgi:hypothetical protein